MSNIKITNAGQHRLTGTRVTLDGIEIPKLSNIKLVHPAGDVAHLELEILATDEFEVVMSAEVTINIVAYPGFEIQGDESGSRRVYRAARKEDNK